jgi:hypothetical protein
MSENLSDQTARMDALCMKLISFVGVKEFVRIFQSFPMNMSSEEALVLEVQRQEEKENLVADHKAETFFARYGH